MIKREVLFGFITGLGTTLVGMLLYILLFSELDLGESLQVAVEQDFLGTLILAGAVLNFLPFFLFLNRKRIYRARGVLLASLLAALALVVLKLY